MPSAGRPNDLECMAGVEQSLQSATDNYQPLEREESKKVVRFLLRCLELDPAKRPTALELLSDPWILEGERRSARGAGR